MGNVPLPLDAPEKRYWQRYIYLWLNYALWEEMEAGDPARTREVYRNALKLIPHRLFTFAKVGSWLDGFLGFAWLKGVFWFPMQNNAYTGLHQACVLGRSTCGDHALQGQWPPANRLLSATGVGDGGKL